MTTVGLCMIVRNEAHVIERCLASCEPILSTWCIVDTGSTDGTQDVIRRFFFDRAKMTGKLYERPWSDFGTNRTEALQLFRRLLYPSNKFTDYALVIDADDVLVVDPAAWKPESLTHDQYELPIAYNGLRFFRSHLFRSSKPFRYVGVLHEYPTCDEPFTTGRLEEGLSIRIVGGGARHQDTKKYERDAKVLEKALLAEPSNERYMFYLAQSWRDAGERGKALAAYQRRIARGGWTEETYIAMLEVARLYRELKRPRRKVIEAYLDAFNFHPTRAEPLCEAARFCRLQERYGEAYAYALAGMSVDFPETEKLFVERPVYDWQMKDELSLAAYYTGRRNMAAQLFRELLKSPLLPEDQRARIQTNLSFCGTKNDTIAAVVAPDKNEETGHATRAEAETEAPDGSVRHPGVP